MYTGGRNDKSKNRSGALVYVAVFVLLMLITGGADGALLALIIGILVLAALVYLGLRLGKKYLNNKQETAPRAGRTYTNHHNHKPRSYNPEQMRDLDNVRRLRQLDSFLENGLIDKKEYNVLRSKYERYMRENENS